MSDGLRLLLRIYVRPGAAMSDLLDRGSLLFSCLAVLAVSLAMRRAGMPGSFYTPLLVLAVVYVPGTVLVSGLLARLGAGTYAAMRRDYAPLLTCAGMAWTAAGIPLAVAVWTMPPVAFLPVASAALLYFFVLMFFAVRTVFGASNGAAAGIVALSLIPLAAVPLLAGPLQYLMGWIASPFFLFFAYYYLGGEIGNLGAGLRARQNFHRMMEVSTLNPADADAHYQLGLIYQQRRQYGEAIQRFNKAVAIDARETDAHFQLGRIAREQGRLSDALAHFETVINQDDKHSQSEILREIGAVYVSARQYQHACDPLERYTERRPYDPEGLFYYGEALAGLSRRDEARGMYERAVEAARTAPRYRRSIVARWSRAAQKQLRKVR